MFTFGPITGSEPYYKKLKEKMTELGKAGQASHIELSYEVGTNADLQRKYPGKVTGLKLFAGSKEVKFS